MNVSVNDRRGYPCPECNETLAIINHEWPFGGAWCSGCHTVWRLWDEVPLNDLDAIPETEDDTR